MKQLKSIPILGPAALCANALLADDLGFPGNTVAIPSVTVAVH